MNLSRLTLEWEPLDDQSQGNAGLNVTTAQNVICIGRPGQNVNNTCFIGNIFAVTTGIADAINVVVDSNGQFLNITGTGIRTAEGMDKSEARWAINVENAGGTR